MNHEFLERKLHSRNGVVRKLAAAGLQVRKRLARRDFAADDYRRLPPVLANSFPKSGTHLLDQVVSGLPGRVNYGAFLSSMTSSFQLTARSDDSVRSFLRACVPGEIVRAHLNYCPGHDELLASLNFVHYFIYRDPRDVVVSASHYLRHMNRWHRLSGRFRSLPSDEDGILLSIVGLQDKEPRLPLPNVNERFKWYEGWLSSSNVCSVRYEDLIGTDRTSHLTRLVEFYSSKCITPVSTEQTVERILAQIAPEKSHTFRSGKEGGWRNTFTPRLKDAFKEATGDLLIRLGYEKDDAW